MIYTVGHSTRSLEDFVALLSAHSVSQLADIRSMPRSRRHPHFAGDALAASLAGIGVAYRHFPALGGMRKPRRGSPNGGWRAAGFRGYADHMQTDAFGKGLDELIDFARGGPTAIMCAEAVWWRCHRQLTADALVARGIDVGHITSAGAATPHVLTEFARVVGGGVIYPGVLDG